MKACRRINLTIASTEVVFINWKIEENMVSFRPQQVNEETFKCPYKKDSGIYFVRAYMDLHVLLALSSELHCCFSNKIHWTLTAG